MIIINKDNNQHTRTEAELKELRERLSNLEQDNATTSEKNMYLTFEQLIRDKQLITKAELKHYEEKMHALLQESQLKLIKWIVGTGISTIGAITAIIGLFY
ncbi:hypothetical protein [Virgibacillus sp. SK37]|uniref:hypothetical protein n=1 Tax=Virgibacillus sp. SK37 TaxID=403957 RepID=UPI0004D11A89|nr:hypothetical protein [Virgibacillus sp. SK37]AIF45515.1 hypothetical protein X953_15255 [Virgibacillus sp. SK37]